MATIDSKFEKQAVKQNTNVRIRVSPLMLGAYAVLIAVIFVPVTVRMINTGYDFPMHIYWAWYWDTTGMVPAALPHFLYQVLVRLAAHILPGRNFDMGAAFVGLICYAASGILIFTTVYPVIRSGSQMLRTIVAMAISLLLVLAGPINLLTWASNDMFQGYIPTSAYHSPTLVLLRPLALLLFVNCVRVFTTSSVSRFSLVAAAVVTALCTLAKPNYTVAIIPALGLLSGYAFIRRQRVNWPLLIIGIFVPAGEILLWQLNHVRGTELGGFMIAPFAVMSIFSPTNLLPKFLLSILFPLVVTAFYWQNARRDKGMVFAWVSFAVGAFYTYFISESQNPSNGNFTWSGQITLFVLFVVSAVFFVRQNHMVFSERRFKSPFLICTFILTLHLVGGIALYISSLNPRLV